MTSRPLNEAEFGAALTTYQRSAERLELQRRYLEPSEAEPFAAWLAGDRTPPTQIPALADWYRQIRRLVDDGRTMARVRVHDEPPTDYQRWERWGGRWSLEAGETLRYLTRRHAHKVGLLPGAGNQDWWLIDDEQLIVMTFDADGRRIRNDLTDDPAAIEQARHWWDLAVRHSVPDTCDAPTNH